MKTDGGLLLAFCSAPEFVDLLVGVTPTVTTLEEDLCWPMAPQLIY